ncbi:acyltransferase [Sphingomonas sp. DC2300-3]|uniref:acyltransferase n=1 Tax=unclassified Sphingomonas TaxID=196159 RepID=UPI003CF70F79
MFLHLVQFLLRLLPPTRLFGFRRAVLRAAGVDLADDARVCGDGWFYGRGSVTIGRGSWISPRGVFYSHPAATIVIGERCDIGHEVSFVTGSHDLGPASRRAGTEKALPITIGDGCWIGARCTVLGGATIGAGTIVAAGAVVVGPLPPNVLAAGVPAAVKRVLEG